jgi:hypothetical protein
MFCKFEHMCYFNVQAPITTKHAYWWLNMCYFNVQASITTENAYWLFVRTAKRTWRVLFPFNLKGSTIWLWNWLLIQIFERHSTLLFSPSKVSLRMLKILKSSAMRWGWVLNFQKIPSRKGSGFWKQVRAIGHICIYPIWYPINTLVQKQIPASHWCWPIGS